LIVIGIASLIDVHQSIAPMSEMGQKSPVLFDQFVGAAEQGERNGEAERLGGLKVALRAIRTARDSRSRDAKAALVGEV